LNAETYIEFEKIVNELSANELVASMKNYKQHGCVTTYEHCISVAKTSVELGEKLHMKTDLTTLVTGAVLHDFYLYDWHEKDGGAHEWHGFIHARIAARNAKKYMNADAKIQHIIDSHMWPLNLTHFPGSKEAWLVCLADKYVSCRETIFERKEKHRKGVQKWH